MTIYLVNRGRDHLILFALLPTVTDMPSVIHVLVSGELVNLHELHEINSLRIGIFSSGNIECVYHLQYFVDLVDRVPTYSVLICLNRQRRRGYQNKISHSLNLAT